MKKIISQFVLWLLVRMAKMVLWRYNPKVIGVTGSVGKTSTKNAIFAVLSAVRRVRASSGNFNGEIGIPFTILGDWDKEDISIWSREFKPGENRAKKFIFLFRVLIHFLRIMTITKKDYPEILVLEYGIDHPGDMKKLLAIARPTVSVLTAIGKVPAHVEFFAGPGELAREKGKILETLPSAGFAILNHDDERVMDMKIRTRAQLMTYGFSSDATVRISSFEHRLEDGRPAGMTFKIEYGGSFVPVRLTGVFGKGHAFAAGAAATIGIIFGMNLVDISVALEDYETADHRMNLVPGINYIHIIDDSYNASPAAMEVALEALADISAKRKIAVLGDMLEIGKYAEEAHEKVGKLAQKATDILIVVGPRAKYIASGAKKAKMPAKKIQAFDTVEEASEAVLGMVKEGDLLLVKASHAIGLDKLVDSLRAF